MRCIALGWGTVWRVASLWPHTATHRTTTHPVWTNLNPFAAFIHLLKTDHFRNRSATMHGVRVLYVCGYNSLRVEICNYRPNTKIILRRALLRTQQTIVQSHLQACSVNLWSDGATDSYRHVRSDLAYITSSVIQGSCLGPILFVLFINDLPDVFTDAITLKLYSDDVKLYSNYKTSSLETRHRLARTIR